MTEIKKMIMANEENIYPYFIAFYDKAKKLANEKAKVRFDESSGKEREAFGATEIADELGMLFAHQFSYEDFRHNGAREMYRNVWGWNMPAEYIFDESGLKIALCQQVLVGMFCEGKKKEAILSWKVLRLQSICEAYMTHLRRDIDKLSDGFMSHDEIMEKALNDLPTVKLKYTVKVYQLVSGLLSLLQGDDSDAKKVKKFRRGFKKARPDIEGKEEQSRSTTAFLKQIIKIIGASIEKKLSFFHQTDKQSDEKSGPQIAAKK